MLRLLLVSPSKYLKLATSRLIRPILWEFWHRGRIAHCTDNNFFRLFKSFDERREFLAAFHSEVRFRFFFHPRNQKDFFLNLLARTQSEESILSEAQDVLENKFDTLGSGKIELGGEINWHRDFKSGKVWGVKLPLFLDLLDLKNPSDVKVPWELSRFHQVWWLGKAYWLTRDEKYAAKFVGLIEDWMRNNPVGRGVNWSVAMEVAFRAMNWIAGYYFFCESRTVSDEFWMRFFKSLYGHGMYIRNHLEHTWRNENHFLSDVVGLIVLGIFFRKADFGRSWISWGINNLEREMADQVCEDGVDYEKSTSYQRLVTELFYTTAILCSKNNIPLSAAFMKRLENMFGFVRSYTRPDGSIPLFGDADDGRLFRFVCSADINDHRHVLCIGAILFNRADFKRAAGSFCQDALWLFGGEGFERYQTLKPDTDNAGSRAFPSGGFYVMRNNDVHLMIDAGDIGTGGMGGHGHNDTLSFEFWVNGESLIVDSGTYAYTFDTAARQEFRGGKSHNAIVMDGKETARFVGLWLIRNDRTRPRVFEWTSSPDKDILEAAHYAYRTAMATTVQRRRFVLDKRSMRLEITDTLQGMGSHKVESYLHFAPSVTLEKIDPRNVLAVTRNARYTLTNDVGEFRIVPTWFSRSYGIKERNQSVVLETVTGLPRQIVTVISPVA